MVKVVGCVSKLSTKLNDIIVLCWIQYSKKKVVVVVVVGNTGTRVHGYTSTTATNALANPAKTSSHRMGDWGEVLLCMCLGFSVVSTFALAFTLQEY